MLRDAWKVCGNLASGSPYIVSSAFDEATRCFGYQMSKLDNPEARTHSYSVVPGTFALHPADVALSAIRTYGETPK